jgi:YVTN family beta-propeller protein
MKDSGGTLRIVIIYVVVLFGFLQMTSAQAANSSIGSIVSSNAADVSFADAPRRPQATQVNGMVFDPVNQRLFVTNSVQNSVTVHTDNGTTLTQIASIAVGTSPFGIGLVDNKVYVANWGPDPGPSSVSVINATTLQKITDIPIPVETCGGQASHVAVNPLTHRVYVAMHAVSGPVVVINSQNDSLLPCVNTNTGAFGIAAHPASNSIFVGSRDGLDLWRIDDATNTSAQVVDWRFPPGTGPGGSPYYVGVNNTTNRLYAMVGTPNSDVPDKLFAYDIGSGGALTEVAGSPATVGNTDDGGYVLQTGCPDRSIYVAVTNIENNGNTVAVRNSNLSAQKTITVGLYPHSLAENLSLGHLYVGNKGSNSISIIQSCYHNYLPLIQKNP